MNKHFASVGIKDAADQQQHARELMRKAAVGLQFQ